MATARHWCGGELPAIEKTCPLREENTHSNAQVGSVGVVQGMGHHHRDRSGGVFHVDDVDSVSVIEISITVYVLICVNDAISRPIFNIIFAFEDG
jgi:hypothetical protein